MLSKVIAPLANLRIIVSGVLKNKNIGKRIYSRDAGKRSFFGLGTLLFKLIHDLVIHSKFIHPSKEAKIPDRVRKLVVHLPNILRVRIFPLICPYKADAIRIRPWFDSRRGMLLGDLTVRGTQERSKENFWDCEARDASHRSRRPVVNMDRRR